jgi:hypothetical protein
MESSKSIPKRRLWSPMCLSSASVSTQYLSYDMSPGLNMSPERKQAQTSVHLNPAPHAHQFIETPDTLSGWCDQMDWSEPLRTPDFTLLSDYLNALPQLCQWMILPRCRLSSPTMRVLQPGSPTPALIDIVDIAFTRISRGALQHIERTSKDSRNDMWFTG